MVFGKLSLVIDWSPKCHGMFEAAEVAAEFLEQQPQFAEMGGMGHDASLPQRQAKVDISVFRRV